ncbi:hypothetical protein F4776DRAFT_634676 [Hypoxylon sp. NC0597]|nr:hypothetical protein F4776DRAFT_634676 [Hypoxylon sp. NC0597]
MVDDVVMGPPHLPPGSAPTYPTLPYLPYPGEPVLGGPVLPYPYPRSLAVVVLVKLDLNFITQSGVAQMSIDPLARSVYMDSYRQQMLSVNFFFPGFAHEMDNSFFPGFHRR